MNGGKGPDAVLEIHPSLANKLENDADNNLLSDSVTGNDVAGVIQVNFTVPANGSYTVTFSATHGIRQTLSGGTIPNYTTAREWQ